MLQLNKGVVAVLVTLADVEHGGVLGHSFCEVVDDLIAYVVDPEVGVLGAKGDASLMSVVVDIGVVALEMCPVCHLLCIDIPGQSAVGHEHFLQFLWQTD